MTTSPKNFSSTPFGKFINILVKIVRRFISGNVTLTAVTSLPLSLLQPVTLMPLSLLQPLRHCRCRCYRNDVLPVALGARPEDYEALAPPHSYIHVDDFESPRHLAEYLHKLDKNDDLYNEYFRWKGTGEAANPTN